MALTSLCTIPGHGQAIMTQRVSKTKFDTDGNPKIYFAHSAPDGSLCFGESIRKGQERQTNSDVTTSPKTAPLIAPREVNGMFACNALNNAVALAVSGKFDIADEQALERTAQALYEILMGIK